MVRTLTAVAVFLAASSAVNAAKYANPAAVPQEPLVTKIHELHIKCELGPTERGGPWWHHYNPGGYGPPRPCDPYSYRDQHRLQREYGYGPRERPRCWINRHGERVCRE